MAINYAVTGLKYAVEPSNYSNRYSSGIDSTDGGDVLPASLLGKLCCSGGFLGCLYHGLLGWLSGS